MTTPIFRLGLKFTLVLKFTAGAAVLACAMALSVAAYARGGGGGHFGGGRAFAARPHFAPHNTPRFNAVRNARAAMGTTPAADAAALAASQVNMMRNASAVQRSLNARLINRTLNNTVALREPRFRALITASVATAAWHGANWSWWRHRNLGFGWVGPLFWPFAFYDIYDYAFWGYPYDDAFWGYGYPDLYAWGSCDTSNHIRE